MNDYTESICLKNLRKQKSLVGGFFLFFFNLIIFLCSFRNTNLDISSWFLLFFLVGKF